MADLDGAYPYMGDMDGIEADDTPYDYEVTPEITAEGAFLQPHQVNVFPHPKCVSELPQSLLSI